MILFLWVLSFCSSNVGGMDKEKVINSSVWNKGVFFYCNSHVFKQNNCKAHSCTGQHYPGNILILWQPLTETSACNLLLNWHYQSGISTKLALPNKIGINIDIYVQYLMGVTEVLLHSFNHREKLFGISEEHCTKFAYKKINILTRSYDFKTENLLLWYLFTTKSLKRMDKDFSRWVYQLGKREKNCTVSLIQAELNVKFKSIT